MASLRELLEDFIVSQVDRIQPFRAMSCSRKSIIFEGTGASFRDCTLRQSWSRQSGANHNFRSGFTLYEGRRRHEMQTCPFTKLCVAKALSGSGI